MTTADVGRDAAIFSPPLAAPDAAHLLSYRKAVPECTKLSMSSACRDGDETARNGHA
ncbi:hypothetical protein ACTJKH_10605 [Microbacterium sp. 22215]|uniref:hypothetical protein n=1 Tax=Microbacterium sp. 22215 TaxID=3453893 RepID=UPI003F87843A